MSFSHPPIDESSESAPPPRPSPAEFIDAITAAQPGWSQPHGGPDGVIALTGLLLEELAEQSRIIAAVRTAAIREQLATEPGAVIARRHHLSRQAIHRAANARRTWEGETW
ncbi:hypothetical protein [Kocuria marina]|uniref:hypothetical protein n=1 Tax=Kocuria marina TaxID=223184 RepID=UPI0011C45470|nr:hypothetical protein [Kocuria indica]